MGRGDKCVTNTLCLCFRLLRSCTYVVPVHMHTLCFCFLALFLWDFPYWHCKMTWRPSLNGYSFIGMSLCCQRRRVESCNLLPSFSFSCRHACVKFSTSYWQRIKQNDNQMYTYLGNTILILVIQTCVSFIIKGRVYRIFYSWQGAGVTCRLSYAQSALL